MRPEGDQQKKKQNFAFINAFLDDYDDDDDDDANDNKCSFNEADFLSGRHVFIII